MHASVMAFVADQVSRRGMAAKSVLDVGSMDVNGSPRSLFSGPYTGLDMRDGPGVDLVGAAERLPWGHNQFDVVVCTEMLEHDPVPWKSVPEMARVLKPGGTLLLTARGIGFPLHEYPSDYWRFTKDAIRLLINGAGLHVDELMDDPEQSGVFCVGMKP